MGCLVVMAFMVSVDVFLRAVFNSPLPASVELSQFLLAWVVFPPLAYALVTGTHVRVSILLDRVPPRVRSACNIFSYAVDIVFFVILTHWGLLQFWGSYASQDVMLAAIWIPWWGSKMAMPVGIFFIAALCFFYLLASFVQLRGKKDKLLWNQQ